MAITDLLVINLKTALGKEVEVVRLSLTDTQGESGIVEVALMIPSGVTRVD